MGMYLQWLCNEYKKCPICACTSCPFKLACSRTIKQPKGFHVFQCQFCGCPGERETEMRFEQFVEPEPSEYQNHLEEYDNMITPQATSKQSGTPGNRKQDGISKLTHADLEMAPKELKILAVREDKKFERVDVKVMYGGSLFIWQLKLTNPSLAKLCEILGNDETKWEDRTVMIALEKNEFDGKSWPVVHAAKKK